MPQDLLGLTLAQACDEVITNFESFIDELVSPREITNTGVGNGIDVPKLQENFGTLWFIYKNRFEGISREGIVAGDLMNVSNLSVNVSGRERFRR